jgi:hypothetical protein
MKAKQWELKEIEAENLSALSRIESLYLALNDLEAFERKVLAGGKNCPGGANPARPSLPVLCPRHAN